MKGKGEPAPGTLSPGSLGATANCIGSRFALLWVGCGKISQWLSLCNAWHLREPAPAGCRSLDPQSLASWHGALCLVLCPPGGGADPRQGVRES